VITGPGVPTVLIGKMPAATMGDMHLCPMMTPGTPPIPHVGGPITLGSTGVFIGKKPAARMGDMAVCVGPPSSVIMGCPTVMIGEVGSGSQAGSAGAAAAAAVASIKGPKSVNAIKPPERQASPVEDASDISVSVTDSAGKPLSGMSFLLEDPDGTKHLVATSSDGSFLRPGPWKKGKSFKVVFRGLTEVKIDKAEFKDGDVATFSAKVEGYDNGAKGQFRLSVLSPQGEVDLVHLSAAVKGGKLEAKWTYRMAQVHEGYPNQEMPPDQCLEVRLVAICGFDTAVGASTSKLKIDPPKPVVVRMLRSA
jgi:uncharacterized Zn-binding protein involved in type VI secretion